MIVELLPGPQCMSVHLSHFTVHTGTRGLVCQQTAGEKEGEGERGKEREGERMEREGKREKEKGAEEEEEKR